MKDFRELKNRVIQSVESGFLSSDSCFREFINWSAIHDRNSYKLVSCS